MNAQTDISTPLVRAFAYAWDAIQKRNPEVPNVVITFGDGSMGFGLRKNGHFAPNRWARGEEHIHELFIGGEGLERTPEEVMGTLLHEAAHGLAIVRDVQDVSREGRYHNGTFKALGEELGIELAYSKAIGWSKTTITPAAVKTYAAAIRRLEAAMVAYRRDPMALVSLPGGLGGLLGGATTKGRRKPGTSRNGQVLECACEHPRKIRVSDSTAELGPITCGICGADFS